LVLYRGRFLARVRSSTELGLQFMGVSDIYQDKGIIVGVYDKKNNVFTYDKICH